MRVPDLPNDGHDRLFYTLFPDPSSGSRCSLNGAITAASTPTCATEQTFEKQTYDENHNRTGHVTRIGHAFTWSYDALNRIRTKNIAGGTPALPAVVYGYNLLGEPLGVSSLALGAIPAHKVAYDYDDAGRKRYEENTLNGTVRRVSYGYDEAGNRTRTTWPDNYFIAYEFDALNRMTYARENGTVELAHYQYDTLSRREGLQFANAATNSIGYTYEPDSNLDVLTNVLNGATVTLDYGYNRSGQIRSISASDDFYLPSPSSSNVSAYVPDKLNRYASIEGVATAYDRNGNLLSWGLTPSRHTYTYDAENRLRTASVAGGSNSSYDYDALGRRLSKTVGGTTTYYLLDGDEEIAEYSSSGTALRRYIMGPSVDDRIARVEGSATTNPTKTYYHTNHQGSVIATTHANGSIAQQLAYDEYGNLTSQQPPASITGEPFRYTGRRFDPETGLYYYRARYYSPESGRFLQTDPIGYRDDLNLYAYVGSDPANLFDPSGMERLAFEFQQAVRKRGGNSPSVGTTADALSASKTLRATIGGGLIAVAAPIVAVAALEGGVALLANAPAANSIAIALGEISAGDAIGGGALTAVLTSRAAQIHEGLDSVAQGMRTTAVVETAEGVRVVASSERSLTSAQKALLEPGDIAAVGAGHAEIKAVQTAKGLGLTPSEVGASREVCDECARQLVEMGVKY